MGASAFHRAFQGRDLPGFENHLTSNGLPEPVAPIDGSPSHAHGEDQEVPLCI
jgi:hypothetical protein